MLWEGGLRPGATIAQMAPLLFDHSHGNRWEKSKVLHGELHQCWKRPHSSCQVKGL
jgi:hypothetical protein